MLVVAPSTLRFEAEYAATAAGHEEYLLERVSILENHLGRVTEKLEQSLNLLLRHAESSYTDQMLLQTLITVLTETGAIDGERFGRLWRENSAREPKGGEKEKTDEQIKHEKTRALLIAECDDAPQTATALIEEAFSLFEVEEMRASGMHALERAAALAPRNAPLHLFLGEHFLREGKTALASSYLSQAHKIKPEASRTCLLLAVAVGDEGESAWARELLEKAVRAGASSFAAHYALGRLYAVEDDWTNALAQFKRAIRVSKSARPEGHYLVGVACGKLNRHRLAARYLRQALEIDPHYAEAHFALGAACLSIGEHKLAAAAFAAAGEAKSTNRKQKARGRASLYSPDAAQAAVLTSLFGAARTTGKKLLTGGNSRIAKALIEDAISFEEVRRPPRTLTRAQREL